MMFSFTDESEPSNSPKRTLHLQPPSSIFGEDLLHEQSPTLLQKVSYWESPIDLNHEFERLFNDPTAVAAGFDLDVVENPDLTNVVAQDHSEVVTTDQSDAYNDSFQDLPESGRFLNTSCSPYFRGSADEQNPRELSIATNEISAQNSETYLSRSPSYNIFPEEQLDQDGPLRRHSSTTRNKVVKEWFVSNLASPYPTKDDLKNLAAASGLSLRQTRVSLSNLRARMKSGNLSVLRKSATAGSTESQSTASMRLLLPSHSTIVDSSLGSQHGLGQSYGEGWTQSLTDPHIHAASSKLIHPLSWPTTPQPVLAQPSDRGESMLHRRPALKRKGKKQDQYWYNHEGISLERSASTPESMLVTKDTADMFQCTVCPRSFKNVSDWKRHEAGVHSFHITEWVCMLDECVIDGLVRCVFCTESITSMDHFDIHRVMNCSGKEVSARTFARKDALRQHVLGVHLSSTNDEARKSFKVPETWARDVNDSQSNPDALWCGFCQLSLPSIRVRMDHVAKHFRSGVEMRFWVSRSKAWQ
ncbi:hypothetical protein ACN47E_005296 [Coniothyrium glycines]